MPHHPAPPAVVLLLAALAAPAPAQLRLPSENLEELQALVRSDSNEARVHYFLGLGYWKKRKWAEADSALRTAVRLDPRFAEAYLALGYLPYARRPQLFTDEARGRVPRQWKDPLEEARRFSERAYLVDPLVSLEIISFAFPVDDSGFRDYTSAESKLYEYLYEWFVELGRGNYSKAYWLLDRLARRVYWGHKDRSRVPNYVLWYRGNAAARAGLLDSAVLDFETLLRRNLEEESKDELIAIPLRTNEYRYVLGVLHQLAGRRDTAVALFREALTHDVGLYMAHVRLAAMHDADGEAAAALAERRRAVETNPDDHSLLVELGVALAEAGELADGEETLRRAATASPRDAFPHYALGAITEHLGRTAEAREHFAQFLALAPKRLGNYAADARARLARLQAGP
ncbi:MAG TPA: tetratricopeptide repeat protein [Gemmatimonadales bacterium]|nr:tetratricopeptide repeat protein [Gemmatimonadales bacterium]